MAIVHLNGEYLPKEEAVVSVDDRGFLFGDGVYEVTPAFGGNFLRMDRHMARLRRGLDALSLEFDPAGVPALHEEMLRRNGLENAPMAIVYLQVTRGAAPRTHHYPPADTPPTVYAYAKAFQRPAPEEWGQGYGAVTYPDRRWNRCDLKTLQLLPCAMAQEAARQAGEADAILVRDGMALEGSHNNLFFVFGRTVCTHPLSNQVLPGITREFVLELAAECGFQVAERPTTIEEMARADEAFFTGTTTEIRPTVRIDGKPVGKGVVGPVVRELHRAFLEKVADECGIATASSGEAN